MSVSTNASLDGRPVRLDLQSPRLVLIDPLALDGLLDLDSFESVDAHDPDPGVFEIDSGTVVVIDLSALLPVASTLTRDGYDYFLQSPIGDDSRLMAINDDVGGSRFAIISADASRPFSGDGPFRLLTDRVVRVR